MSIRKILLPLIGVECDEPAIKTAFVTTKALQAHLDAVFVRPDPKETLPYFGEGLSGAVIQDILDAAKEAGAATINYGVFINNVISFLIVAFAVFLLVKSINAMKRKEEEKPAAPPKPSAEVTLLTEIRDALKKG